MQSTATFIDCTTHLEPSQLKPGHLKPGQLRPSSLKPVRSRPSHGRRYSRRNLKRGPAHAGGRRPKRVIWHRQRLVRYAASRIRSMSSLLWPRVRDVLDYDDLLSCGGEAVARHLPRYDPAIAPFRAYIDQRLRWAILQEARKCRRRAYDLCHGKPSVVAERYQDLRPGRVRLKPSEEERLTSCNPYRHSLGCINWWPAGDMAEAAVAREPDPEERLQSSRLRQRLATVLKTLSERHRLVVKRHYYEGAPFAAVAREMGITRSAVCRIHKLALRTLCKRLGAHIRQFL